ncbi:MAG: GAF domain-containing protein [Candidatus Puniceispirillaceae bacterium]
MNMGLAPRPANEELRAQTVVKTGLIDAPNPDMFQIYCDLAKDLTGFETATFSLYDGEMQCAIAKAGVEDFVPGSKTERSDLNVCSYVLLDTEPLLMEDMIKDPTWKDHPALEGLEKGPGYAGFPVINSENFALGTLCMINFSGPKGLKDEQVTQVKKITSSIAQMLDLQIKQKELTSQRMLDALAHFQKIDGNFGLNDFKIYMSLCSEMNVPGEDAAGLIRVGLAEIDGAGRVQMTEAGRRLQFDMNLQQKAMKRIKMDAGEAEALLDEMFAEIE